MQGESVKYDEIEMSYKFLTWITTLEKMGLQVDDQSVYNILYYRNMLHLGVYAGSTEDWHHNSEFIRIKCSTYQDYLQNFGGSQ